MKIIINSIVFIFVSFLITSFILLVFPKAYEKLFVSDPNPGFGDTPYYTSIAKDGYNKEVNWAYYPLYPITLRLISELFNIPLERSAVIVSIFFFIISIPITLKVFYQVLEERIANVFTLLYILNPKIIFHYIGYTESLFSLLLITLIMFILNYSKNPKVYFALIFLTSILLSLTRPIVIQFIFSIILAIIIKIIFDKKEKINEIILPAIGSTIGSLIGYSIFGFYALSLTGNFFKPFSVQSLWDKKIGFYVNNLWANGTTWDVVGLYLGIFLVIFLLYAFIVSFTSNKRNEVFSDFVFLFSFLFFISHVGIVFFTQNGDLRSLGRYVFSIPTTFLFLGIIYRYYETNVLRWVASIFLLFSLSSLIYWWYMYSNTLWIG